jgi:hypothetical protein
VNVHPVFDPARELLMRLVEHDGDSLVVVTCTYSSQSRSTEREKQPTFHAAPGLAGPVAHGAENPPCKVYGTADRTGRPCRAAPGGRWARRRHGVVAFRSTRPGPSHPGLDAIEFF